MLICCAYLQLRYAASTLYVGFSFVRCWASTKDMHMCWQSVAKDFSQFSDCTMRFRWTAVIACVTTWVPFKCSSMCTTSVSWPAHKASLLLMSGKYTWRWSLGSHSRHIYCHWTSVKVNRPLTWEARLPRCDCCWTWTPGPVSCCSPVLQVSVRSNGNTSAAPHIYSQRIHLSCDKCQGLVQTCWPCPMERHVFRANVFMCLSAFL